MENIENRKNIWKKFICQKENHEDEQLNILCLDCKNDRIICIECLEENHIKHKTISMKKFIDSFNKNKMEAESCEKIEKNFGEIINYAKEICEKINKNFEEIIIKLEKCKNSCLNDSDDILEKLKKLGIINSLDSFRNLLEVIIPKFDENLKKNPIEKIEKIINKNILIKTNLEKVFENCKKNFNETQNFIENYHKNFPKEILQFDKNECNDDIEITEDNLKAKKKNKTGITSILLDKNLTNENEFKWKIKCINHANWIGVGIGIKEILKKTNYLSDSHMTKCGLFLFSFNSFLWSHRLDSENSKQIVNKKMNNGEIIELKYISNENKLLFYKNNEKIGELNKIKMENENFFPVVVLFGQNDEVEIIN